VPANNAKAPGLSVSAIRTSRGRPAAGGKWKGAAEVQARLRLGLSAAPLLVLVGACAGPQAISVHSSQTKPPSVTVFERIPEDAVDLGEISETTCLNNFLDPRPGWQRALDNLKAAALEKGANAVSLVTYEDSNRLFCATGLKLTAHAIVATPSSLQQLKRPPASQQCDAGNLSDFMACKLQALPRSP
jgi:hypothetical protein